MNNNRVKQVEIYSTKQKEQQMAHNVLISTLEEYVKDEVMDSLYYEALANLAPIETQKKIITDIANDEKKHSEMLTKLIHKLDSSIKVSVPKTLENPPLNFANAIYKRIVAETNDYKKYGEMYIKSTDPLFKNTFFELRTDENRHAHLLNMMLNMLP